MSSTSPSPTSPSPSLNYTPLLQTLILLFTYILSAPIFPSSPILVVITDLLLFAERRSRIPNTTSSSMPKGTARDVVASLESRVSPEKLRVQIKDVKERVEVMKKKPGANWSDAATNFVTATFVSSFVKVSTPDQKPEDKDTPMMAESSTPAPSATKAQARDDVPMSMTTGEDKAHPRPGPSNEVDMSESSTPMSSEDKGASKATDGAPRVPTNGNTGRRPAMTVNDVPDEDVPLRPVNGIRTTTRTNPPIFTKPSVLPSTSPPAARPITKGVNPNTPIYQPFSPSLAPNPTSTGSFARRPSWRGTAPAKSSFAPSPLKNTVASASTSPLTAPDPSKTIFSQHVPSYSSSYSPAPRSPLANQKRYTNMGPPPVPVKPTNSFNFGKTAKEKREHADKNKEAEAARTLLGLSSSTGKKQPPDCTKLPNFKKTSSASVPRASTSAPAPAAQTKERDSESLRWKGEEVSTSASKGEKAKDKGKGKEVAHEPTQPKTSPPGPSASSSSAPLPPPVFANADFDVLARAPARPGTPRPTATASQNSSMPPPPVFANANIDVFSGLRPGTPRPSSSSAATASHNMPAPPPQAFAKADFDFFARPGPSSSAPPPNPPQTTLPFPLISSSQPQSHPKTPPPSNKPTTTTDNAFFASPASSSGSSASAYSFDSTRNGYGSASTAFTTPDSSPPPPPPIKDADMADHESESESTTSIKSSSTRDLWSSLPTGSRQREPYPSSFHEIESELFSRCTLKPSSPAYLTSCTALPMHGYTSDIPLAAEWTCAPFSYDNTSLLVLRHTPSGILYFTDPRCGSGSDREAKDGDVAMNGTMLREEQIRREDVVRENLPRVFWTVMLSLGPGDFRELGCCL